MTQIAHNILTGASDHIAEWVRQQLDMPFPFGNVEAIGFVKDGKIIAGVAYSNLETNRKGQPHSCEISIASIDPSWCTRRALRVLAGYPFKVLGCKYIWSRAKKSNKRSRDFTKRLGFKELCIIPDGDPDGGAVAMYQMRAKDCRWL